jgi:pyridoxamine 5'-phosphate oxidase
MNHDNDRSLDQPDGDSLNTKRQPGLHEDGMADDPFVQFDRWFAEAVSGGVREPEAMCLSTATPEGKPSGRMVLLKGYDEKGFVFFTNYDSRKGEELKRNGFAALTFYWAEPYRQVRIEGAIQQVSEEESDRYFGSRPRGSQVSARSSAQSAAVASRAELENKARAVEEQFMDKPIPRPENWGGFRLVPSVMEFWQGRDDRLHDRILYSANADGGWSRIRLCP